MVIGEEIARLAVALSMDTSDFATGKTRVQRDLGQLQASFKSLGDKWMQTGKRLSIGVTAPLAAFGIASAKTASDAQELDSAFTETFDNLAGAMRIWARETGDAMGRSTQSVQEMANTFGIFFNQAAPTRAEAAEMSKTFTVLAQDLSSFYNVSGDEALQKLRSGLSGESEPLRDFGVFLTEATVKAKAMEMGLTGLGDELTEQEKILARYQLILESTSDAQGDVSRTSGGAANQWRSFTEALEELRVVIGERLLPLLTPLVAGMTNVVNGFNNLPSGVQTAIVAVGAMMAAIGPMMLVMGTLAATVLPLFAAKFGPIGIAISAFVNPLGTAISFLVKFAAQLAGMTVLKSIGAMLLRFAGPVGLVASAGLLIYKNWDRISAVFAEFWEAAQQALGPPLQELISVLSDMFGALWDGPVGSGIQSAIGVLKSFGAAVGEFLGDALIFVLKRIADGIVTAFEIIGGAISLVARLLRGDWAGAWDAAKSIVKSFLGPIAPIVSQVISWIGKMVTGVTSWLRKLSNPFNWVADKLTWIGSLFFKLYDKVVGNSYIPDMVDAIGVHMRRLQAEMVDPAQKAIAAVQGAFAGLEGDMKALFGRLFPELAAARKEAEELGMIDSSDLSPEAKAALRGRLSNEKHYGDPVQYGPNSRSPLDLIPTSEWKIEGKKAADILGDLADKTKVQTVRIAESFKDMTEKTLSALRGLSDAIRGGDFFGILEGAVGLFMQLGNMGVFGKSLQADLRKTPAYANGTNFHPGGMALVGERGPELVNLPRGSGVLTAQETRGLMAQKLQVEVVANNNGFGAIVRNHAGQVVAEATPQLIRSSSNAAVGQMAQMRDRSLVEF